MRPALLVTAALTSAHGATMRDMHTRGCTQPLDLAVLILSRPTAEGAAQRETSRATWARWPDPCQVRFWFLLGADRYNAEHAQPHATPMAAERRLNATASGVRVRGDELRVPYTEGYRRISLKVLAAMRWLMEEQPLRVRHVLKTDDDTFVCVGGVLRFVRAHQPHYAGKPAGLSVRPKWATWPPKGKPEASLSREVLQRMAKAKNWLPLVRIEPTHRWYDAAYRDVFHTNLYRDYMQGVGYVLSAAVARAVVRNAALLGLGPEHASGMEDAWVGALARHPAAGAWSTVDQSVQPLTPHRAVDAHGRGAEPEIPIALYYPEFHGLHNVTRYCDGDRSLMVHNLTTPAQLDSCTRGFTAHPPQCHVEPLWPPIDLPTLANGRPRGARCTCEAE